MIGSDREYILEEEWLLVRHSGEIPEVALHGSLYYLEEDAEGPKFILSHEEMQQLQQAASARYQEIILRDLDLGNRDLPLFRGIRRANHNWYRFARFCAKESLETEPFRLRVGRTLVGYLEVELAEVGAGARRPSVNCTAEALLTFAQALAVDAASLPQGWEGLCEQVSA